MIMKSRIRTLGMWLARLCGSRLVDVQDGEFLGYALMLNWRGRIHLLGYDGVPLRMVCVPQERIRYWRIELGFTKAAVPDFCRE